MIVHFRGQLVPAEDALVSALAPAFTHGPNVYETVRGYWNDDAGQLNLFRLHDHLRRFRSSMAALRYTDAPDVGPMADAILACVRANEFREDMHLRIHAFANADAEPRGSEHTEFLIIPSPRPPKMTEPARCRIAAWRRPSDDSFPARVKAVGNRMFARVAAAEAKADGYDQVILLNDRGTVAEALSSNIFIVRHGEVCTPPGTAGILEGITRATLLTILRQDMNRTGCEREIDRSEFFDCEEAFLCSTGLEIVPIASIDGLAIGDGRPGSVTSQLSRRYDAITRGQTAVPADWLAPVY